MTSEQLGPLALDALAEIGNISMGAAATALSLIAGTRVRITTPDVKVASWDEIRTSFPMPVVLAKIEYKGRFHATNILLIKEDDALKIVAHMMGAEEIPQTLDAVGASALGEAMNQMIGSATTALSDLLRIPITLRPPMVRRVDSHEWVPSLESSHYEDSMVAVSFDFTVEGLIESTIMQIIPLSDARRMAERLIEGLAESTDHRPGEPVPKAGRSATLRPGAATTGPEDDSSVDLMRDVTVKVRVVLGGMRLTLGEIRSLTKADVLGLNTAVGQPAEIMIGSQRIGWGEVICSNGRYGVRILSLSSQVFSDRGELHQRPRSPVRT